MAVLTGLSSTHAADAPGSLPAGLTELTFSAREGYDSNVFAANNQRSTYAVSNQSSAISTLSAKVAISVSALSGQPKDWLVAGYSIDANWYDSVSSQDFRLNKFFLQSKGAVEKFAWTLDSTTSYIDGNREAPIYLYYSCFGNATPRERLAQIQDRTSVALRYNSDHWFVRASSALLYYDLLTHHHNPVGAYAGYMNFIDRNDLNIRGDFGWKVMKDTFLTLGACLGSQYQQALPWATSYSSNHYRRILLGGEGKPTSWLSLTFAAGPDFRSYPATHSGVRDRTPIVPFIEGTATVTLGKQDSVSVTGKQWRWLSSTGVAALEERTLNVTWKHSFDAQWSTSIGAQYQQYPYVTPTLRNDQLFSGIVQVQFAATKHLLISADYTRQDAENNLNGPGFPGREFKRNQTGASVKYSF